MGRVSGRWEEAQQIVAKAPSYRDQLSLGAVEMGPCMVIQPQYMAYLTKVVELLTEGGKVFGEIADWLHGGKLVIEEQEAENTSSLRVNPNGPTIVGFN